jgi:hypothetical protein
VKKANILFLLILPLISAAQEATVEADSIIHKSVRPAFYFDYGKAASSAFPNNSKWEGGFELMFFDRLQAVIEIGKWDVSPESVISNGDYQMDGTYQRLGVGYLPYVDSESRIGLGFRYATASFSDQGEYTILSPTEQQPDIIEQFERNDISANWYELVVYSDKAINKWLVLGFNFRVRFIQSYDSFDTPDVQVIPGYGRAQDKSVPAFNLFLKIQPF